MCLSPCLNSGQLLLDSALTRDSSSPSTIPLSSQYYSTSISLLSFRRHKAPRTTFSKLLLFSWRDRDRALEMTYHLLKNILANLKPQDNLHVLAWSHEQHKRFTWPSCDITSATYTDQLEVRWRLERQSHDLTHVKISTCTPGPIHRNSPDLNAACAHTHTVVHSADNGLPRILWDRQES